MSTLQEKLIISVFSAVLFALVNLSQTYNLTRKITGINTYDSVTGCPTGSGLLLHTVVFFILTFLSMWNSPVSNGLKVKFSLYGTLIFYFLASPTMFALTGYIFGPRIANSHGCPTTLGVLLHAVVYCAALTGVMYLPPELE